MYFIALFSSDKEIESRNARQIDGDSNTRVEFKNTAGIMSTCDGRNKYQKENR